MVLIKSNVGHKDCKVLICNESVEFNGEGIAEVSSQEKAEEIVEKWGERFSLNGETPETPETPESSDEDPEDSDESPETSEDDDEDEEIDLNEKTVSQLRELCQSIDLPSAEYKSLKKPELIAYIEEKIK